MQAKPLLEEIFKTSLSVEEYYWCNRDTQTTKNGYVVPPNVALASQCRLTRSDEIMKRDPSCQGEDCLYTGPTPLRYWNPKPGMCDDDASKKKYWSCKFRTCGTDGCNFSAAPNNSPHALAAVISGVLSLVLTFPHTA